MKSRVKRMLAYTLPLLGISAVALGRLEAPRPQDAVTIRTSPADTQALCTPENAEVSFVGCGGFF